jgi:hypothetical protein
LALLLLIPPASLVLHLALHLTALILLLISLTLLAMLPARR